VIGLVSIGTIADVVPLTGENRVLVRCGIDSLGRIKHRALSALVNGEKINSRTIGWTIAPLLNTPGRLGKTDLTVKFFTENDERALLKTINEIKTLNESRRNFINDFCAKKINDISTGEQESSGRLIYIKTEDIPDGYAGLIANRISDATGKPVIVAAYPGKNGFIKGSGRSRGGMQFFSLITSLRDRFERIGGHENAFGFTARSDEIDDIIRSIERSMAQNLEGAAPTIIDHELNLDMINVAFIEELQCLEPFGSGNSEPVFITYRAIFESFISFGANHGKYTISGNNPLAAIGWGKGPLMEDYFNTGRPLDLIYRLENSRYNGVVSPRMIISDINFSAE
jgi:single-stranded-DNA-specific exonuclease